MAVDVDEDASRYEAGPGSSGSSSSVVDPMIDGAGLFLAPGVPAKSDAEI